MSKPTINRDSRYSFTHLESEYTYWAITPGHTIARLYVPIGRNPDLYSFRQEFITLQAYGRCRRILQIALPEGMEPDAEEACCAAIRDLFPKNGGFTEENVRPIFAYYSTIIRLELAK